MKKWVNSQSVPQPIFSWNYLQTFRKSIIVCSLLVRASTSRKLLVATFMFLKRTNFNNFQPFFRSFFPWKNSYNKECFKHCTKKILFFHQDSHHPLKNLMSNHKISDFTIALITTDLIVKSFTNVHEIYHWFFTVHYGTNSITKSWSITHKVFFGLKNTATIRNTVYTLIQTRNQKSCTAQ